MTAAAGPVAPIEAGDRLRIPLAEGGPLDVVVESVTQRNWSRVGRARDAGGRPVFVKQFLDRAGAPHAEHRDDERAGTAVLARLAAVDATVLLGGDEDRLLLAFAWEPSESLDELLRSVGDAAFLDRWRSSVLPRLPALLDELVALAGEGGYEGRQKVRAYPSAAEAVLLKGLDVRNLALRSDGTGAPLIFDPGRWYRGPVEEGAAKLLVSIGLLNWGSPPARFRRGVPRSLLDPAAEVLGPRSHRAAVAAEVDLQRRVRLGGAMPTRGLAGRLRTVAARRWGPRYLDELEACLDRWWS